jgi:hypothetical protein
MKQWLAFLIESTNPTLDLIVCFHISDLFQPHLRTHNTEGADPLLVGPVPRKWIRGQRTSGQVAELLEFVEALGISLSGF